MPILILTTYPSTDASRRLRIDPLATEMRARGFEVVVDQLLPEWLFRHKNDSAWWRLLGIGAFAYASLRRGLRILRLDSTDIVLVHREAYPFFTPWIEKAAATKASGFVLDVDDAIHLSPTHNKDWRRWFRNPERAVEVLQLADLVFAGSETMADLAKRAGSTKVALALTSPPAAALAISVHEEREKRILWTGSQSTLGSLQEVLNDVLEACELIDHRLVVLGGANIEALPHHPLLEANRWSPDLEIAELRRSTIGLMPLPGDSQWEHGKSSYKALLYMAAGVLPIVSPVGMNTWLQKQCSSIRAVETGQSWADTIVDVAQDPELSQRRAECKEWALANLGPAKLARSQGNNIQDLVQRG